MRTVGPHSNAIDRALLRAFLIAAGRPPLRCVLPDGQEVYVGRNEPVGTIRFRDRATLYHVMRSPEIGFGEGYTDGRIEIEGDLVEVLVGAYPASTPRWVDRLWFNPRRPRRNSLAGSRRNIHQHYDLGNDFYRMWLDDRMVYTCAYYPTPEATLEEAQVAKMHHVCRKVALVPGERVVEAGCGWGSLALHMARHYGVTVRAFNISHEQIAWAREQAARDGLSDRVEFIEDDYRNVSGTYDCFVSVGMLEHVGPEHYRELGAVINRCLPAHGRGLIHTIGRNRPARLNAWIEKHIFPGGCPPTLRQMMDLFEPFRFSVLDVENLRLHYERTAAAWLQRFERCAAEVERQFDDRFVRAWTLYLAGTTAAFRISLLQLFQVVFARDRHNGIPWTRQHVYES
ncbi:MAG: class I SAM-dependent methyltransferase [Candidatus Binatia bacterium]